LRITLVLNLCVWCFA